MPAESYSTLFSTLKGNRSPYLMTMQQVSWFLQTLQFSLCQYPSPYTQDQKQWTQKSASLVRIEAPTKNEDGRRR